MICRRVFRSDEMDENKFSYKEVFVKYDNVQIGVICSKMVEKVFEYNAHDDEDVSVNYVYYVKKDKFLHRYIYISYKDTTILVVCSNNEEILSLETDGSKELWYYKVYKEKFDSLVAKLLNKDIGNNRKKDSNYFQLYSKSNLIKVFSILDK